MSSKIIFLVLFGFAMCMPTFAETPKPPFGREPDITTDPAYRNNSNPSRDEYTQYKLKDASARNYALSEVQRVIAPNSFVARTLRVITGNGSSKVFETITG